MSETEIGSWQSADYVGRWAGEDVVARLLDTPRRISTALLRDAGARVDHVVDLGSGEGPYLAHVLREFEYARGTWLDSSAPMLERARESLAEFGDRITFVVAAAEELADAGVAPADLVVSSRALHHLTPAKLARCYGEVRALLQPGGWFFNLDHVGSPGDWEQRYRRIRDAFTGARRRSLERHREDEPFHTVADHLRWLEHAGFGAVDFPWRTLYTALLAARV
jgi:ubiquinone/menaquinone biosynthesis C-methylase UbiE